MFLYLQPHLKGSQYGERVGCVKRTAKPKLKRARTISSPVLHKPPRMPPRLLSSLQTQAPFLLFNNPAVLAQTH